MVNDAVAQTYGKLVLSDDARTLLGGILVGDASAYGVLRPMVGEQLPGDPVSFLAPAGSDSGAASLGVGALPETAQICSCNNVSKGDVTEAIGSGCCDVPSLKACTKAGTSCGSCVPLLKQLLEAQGVAQSKALCEHFSQSRPELFEIISATEIRSFSGWSKDSAPEKVATSANPSWRRSWRRRAAITSSTGSRRPCRIRTITSWPTSSATAAIRWCRACPAVTSP